MLIPSTIRKKRPLPASLSRRVNANSQPEVDVFEAMCKLIKKGEC